MCHPMRYKHKPCGHIGAYAGTQECPHVYEIEELRAQREPESNYMYTILRALCAHFSYTLYVDLPEPCPNCKFAGYMFPMPESEVVVAAGGMRGGGGGRNGSGSGSGRTWSQTDDGSGSRSEGSSQR